MALLLAVSLIGLTGVTSFADNPVPGAEEKDPCLDCKIAEEGHVHDDSCYEHSWDDGQETMAATCTEDGEKLFTCTIPGCNATKTEPVSAGHTWNQGEITVAPTCTENGIKQYACTAEGCDTTESVEVKALGHDWDGGSVTTPATDSTSGEKLFTCQREDCDATKTEVIPAKYTYVSGESKWKTNVISFAPTSEGITYEITYTSAKTKDIFTQAEVDVMSKEEIKTHKLFVSQITYTIPKDFEANEVNIFMGDAINNAANYMTYLPGDAAPIQIAIVNHSSHGYGYKNGSFAVTTEDYQQYFDKGWATQSNAIGYDSQSVPEEYLAVRSKNGAIQSLYGVTSTSKVSNEQMTDAVLGAKLVEDGYSNGIDDLHKYYLDYYNEKKNTSYTALEQLPDSEIATLLTSGNTTSVKEQNTEIAELLYNYFYNHLYSLTPAGAGYPGHENNAYTIGSLMRAYQNKQASVFDQSISKAWGDIAASTEDGSGSYLWEGFEAWINGPDTRNTYQNYNYGFTAGFSLERTDTTYSVISKYFTSIDGSAPVLDGSVTRVDQVAIGVGNTASVVPEAAWNTYDGNDYKLEETARLSLVAVVDPASNVIVLNYYRNVSGQVIVPPIDPPVDPPTPPVDPDPEKPLPPDENLEDPEKPDKPADNPNQPLPPDDHLEDDGSAKATKSDNPDQPKTGDESQMALYLILAVGASGALALTVRRKRESR